MEEKTQRPYVHVGNEREMKKVCNKKSEAAQKRAQR